MLGLKPNELIGLFVFGLLFFAASVGVSFAQAQDQPKDTFEGHDTFFGAGNKNIQYTGRIDFSQPNRPRFWAAGVYIRAKFKGTYCDVLVRDQWLGQNNQNYIEIAVDDKQPVRLQLTGDSNLISAATGLPDGEHTITICKDTEAGIGYIDFLGFRCDALLPLPPKPVRKVEFIGDSITNGTGADTSEIPCDKGKWYDQHNAYMSYGPLVARALNAQWHLTAVAGIGLMHSCCDMGLVMPQVFDKLDQRDNTGQWDFKLYQPDAVTICLGQNDGEQDPGKFCENYAAFIKQVRAAYPKAQIVCLNSPMGDDALTAYLKTNITRVVQQVNDAGDKNVHAFFFSQSYHGGCGGHPDLAGHQRIAGELTPYLKQLMGW